MTTLISFLSLISIAILFTSMVKPIEELKKYLGIHYSDEPDTWYIKFLRDLLSCSTCVAFWIGIGYYFSLETAALLSLSTYIVQQIINKL